MQHKENKKLSNRVLELESELEKFKSKIAHKHITFSHHLQVDDHPWLMQACIDADGIIISVNNCWLRVLQYGKEQVVGSNFIEFLVPSDYRQFKKLWELPQSSSEENQNILRFQKHGGEILYIRLYIKEAAENKDQHVVCIDGVDMTQSIISKQKMQDNQVFLEAVFKSIKEGISILNPDLTIRYVNEVMDNWYTNNPALIGKKCHWCFHGKNEPCNPCPAQRCIKTGRTEHNVLPGIPGYNVEWVEVFAYPMKHGKTGEITGIVEFVRDITEKKRAEQQLKKNELYYQSLLNSVSDIIVEISEDGLQKFISPAAETFTGYSIKELQRPFAEVIHPDDIDDILTAWNKCLHDYHTTHTVEYRHIHKTKGYIWVEANARSFLNDPHINSVIVSVRDISERKRAEQVLRDSNNHYKILSTSATEMLGLPDLSAIYTYVGEKLCYHYPQTINAFVAVNEAQQSINFNSVHGLDKVTLSKILNIIGTNLLGKSFKLSSDVKAIKTGKLCRLKGGLDIFSGKAFSSVAAKQIDKVLNIKEMYAVGICKNNKLYAILYMFNRDKNTVIHPAFVEFFLKQAGIVIERKSMETALIKSKSRLSELNITKDKLFSVIGHDLKNPLSNIIGFSRLLHQHRYSSNQVKKFSNHIYSSASAMADLLENLLQWSRAQQNRLTVKAEWFNIEHVGTCCIKLMASAAENKNVTIENKIRKGAPVFADREMITTVIRNLLSNAIKFTHTGGKITLDYFGNEQNCTISISDTGIGMANTKNVFKLDDTYTTPGTDGETGTGLGLVICKEFIDKNNGKIWVDSKPGDGSTFFITLPVN